MRLQNLLGRLLSKSGLKCCLLCSAVHFAVLPLSAQPLDPNTIPKFVNQLKILPVYEPQVVENEDIDQDGCHRKNHGHHPQPAQPSFKYKVTAKEFQQQILPQGFPKTTVLGYGGYVKGEVEQKDKKKGRGHGHDDQESVASEVVFSYPGPTFEVSEDQIAEVRWINRSPDQPEAVNPEINFEHSSMTPAFPPGYPISYSPIPFIANRHKNSQPIDRSSLYSQYKVLAIGQSSALYQYENNQKPTTLFYHDKNLEDAVNAGAVGFYIITNKDKSNSRKDLPTGMYDIPLLIQDRSFNTDGSFAALDSNHLGNTIVINGSVWPNLKVEKKQYRFRILNMSSQRTYKLKIANGKKFVPLTQIGGKNCGPNSSNHTDLTLAPEEYIDVLVDFGQVGNVDKLVLINDAPGQGSNTKQMMQFTITKK